jgi:RHS repeat-associated protein
VYATVTGYRASVPAGHAGSGVAPSYRALSPDGENLKSSFKALPSWGTVPDAPTPFRHTPCHPWLRPNATVWRNLQQNRQHTRTRYSSFFIHHSSLSYTFSAKEKDSETGLSYFGSRYYSSDLSVWLSVDPMAAKYPSTSPYAYCRNNPIRLVDPNGMFDDEAKATRVRNRAAKRFGEDRVSGVYNNTVGDGKANYSFSIYGKGKSKYSRGGGTKDGGPVITCDKADKVVSSGKDFRAYKRSQANLSKLSATSNSLSHGYSLDFAVAFGPFGGSAEFGVITDAKTNETSFFISKGINVGMEISANFNFLIGNFDKNTFAGESVSISANSPFLINGVSTDINNDVPGKNLGNNYYMAKLSLGIGIGGSFSRSKTIVK